MKAATILFTAILLASSAGAPLGAQTLRTDTNGIPQSAPVTGGGTGNDVKIGVAGLTRRGFGSDAVLVLRGSGQVATYNVSGRDVSIQGTGNTIRLKGRVRRLTVIGNANLVSTDVVERVAVSGKGNSVSYGRSFLGDRPQVSQSGGRNQVQKRK